MDILNVLKKNQGVVAGTIGGVFLAPIAMNKATSLVDLGPYTTVVAGLAIAGASLALFGKTKPAAAAAFASVFLAHSIAAVVPQISA